MRVEKDARLRAALRPFERRVVMGIFVRSAMTTAAIAAVASEAVWAAGWHRPALVAALFGAAFLISLVFANARRPAALLIARQIDRRANLQDLMVSAVDSAGDGMSALVREQATNALGHLRAADIYPIEAPAKWAVGFAGVAVIALIMMTVGAPAPAARSSTSGPPPLARPAGSGSAAAPSGPAQAPATAPAPASTAAVNGSTDGAPATANGRVAPADARGAASAPAVAGDDGIRLAAANADADIAAGRVPIARRAIVERYFASLQSVRKPR